MIRQTNRRQFIVGSAGALAIPFLSSLAPRTALAAQALRRCFFTVALAHNYHRSFVWPQGTLQSISDPTYTLQSLDLGGISGPIAPALSDPRLLSLRSKLTLIDGIQFGVGGAPHMSSHVLGCRDAEREGGPKYDSADFVLARSGKIYSGTPAIKVLSYGAGDSSGSPVSGLSIEKTAGGYTNLQPIRNNAKALFDKVFTGFTPGPAGASPGGASTAADPKKYLVDRVLSEVNAVIRKPRLSRDDKGLLQAHIDSLQDIQKVLSAPRAPTPPQCEGIPQYQFSNLTQAQRYTIPVQIMAMAMKCDITRIAGIHCHEGIPGHSDNYGTAHGPTHALGDTPDDPNVRKTMLSWQTFGSSLFAHVVSELNSVVDPNTGKTLLDNSVVYLTNSMGDAVGAGQGAGGQHPTRFLFNALAGSAGGAIRTGRYLKYRVTSGGRDFVWSQIGPSQNQLLISIMRAFGLTPENWENPGVAGYGTYPGDKDPKLDYGRDVLGPIYADKRSALPSLLNS